MPEDPTNPPTTSDPPPGGGSGGSKGITSDGAATGTATDTSTGSTSVSGYTVPEEEPTLTEEEEGTMTGTDPTAEPATKVMPESDPPPGGGSGG